MNARKPYRSNKIMRKWSPQRSRKEAGGRRASERTNVHLTFTFRIRQPAILYPPQYVISTWACPVCSARRHVTGTPSSSYSLFSESFLFFRYSYPSMRRASAAHSTSPAPKTTPSRRPTLEMHDSDDDEEFIRTKILVMGQRRCVPSVEFICGASSCVDHVVHFNCEYFQERENKYLEGAI